MWTLIVRRATISSWPAFFCLSPSNLLLNPSSVRKLGEIHTSGHADYTIYRLVIHERHISWCLAGSLRTKNRCFLKYYVKQFAKCWIFLAINSIYIVYLRSIHGNRNSQEYRLSFSYNCTLRFNAYNLMQGVLWKYYIEFWVWCIKQCYEYTDHNMLDRFQR